MIYEISIFNTLYKRNINSSENATSSRHQMKHMALLALLLAYFVSICFSCFRTQVSDRRYLPEDALRETTTRYFGLTQQGYSLRECVLWCIHRPSCWSVVSCPVDSIPQKYNCILLEELAKAPSVINERNLTTCSFYTVVGITLTMVVRGVIDKSIA